MDRISVPATTVRRLPVLLNRAVQLHAPKEVGGAGTPMSPRLVWGHGGGDGGGGGPLGGLPQPQLSFQLPLTHLRELWAQRSNLRNLPHPPHTHTGSIYQSANTLTVFIDMPVSQSVSQSVCLSPTQSPSSTSLLYSSRLRQSTTQQ